MKALKKQLGEIVNEGRPKGSGTAQVRVYEWRQQHPEGRKADCHRETCLLYTSRAAAALKEFAESFQERNPHLRVCLLYTSRCV